MVRVLYRFRTCVNILMRFSTHSHSSPEEHYSNSVRRKLMCAGRIRGFHPQLLDVANSLHPCPKWRYMRIQQFNAQIIVSNRDLILVHSQWLKAFSVVHFPPLINMLKFGGCASMISCLYMSYVWSSFFNMCEMSPSMLCSAHQNTGPFTSRVNKCLICQLRQCPERLEHDLPHWQTQCLQYPCNMRMLLPLRQTNVRICSDNTLCVQIPMDSRNRTIHNVYHISLHSSSNTEPTHKSIHDFYNKEVQIVACQND